ncbi:MAG: hypothetical protein V3U12_01850 [Nitrosopumilaceae archaeon]
MPDTSSDLSSYHSFHDIVKKEILRMRSVTSEFAKEIHIDRTKAYRTSDKPLNLKIVSTTFSKPSLCIANKPEDVLECIAKKKKLK